ncbi:MAG TPA: threonine/serine dehydratase [Candidatus Bathyarchaeia archaeon]
MSTRGATDNPISLPECLITMKQPTLMDILDAQKRIRPYLPTTPLYTYPTLNRLLGFAAYVKHENHNPTGAFKIRGGINLVSRLDASEREKGVVTASTGNHGQSIALACSLFGVKAHVCVPEGANPDKVAAIRSHGAEIVEHGRDFEDAKVNAERLAEAHGYRFISSGDEPHLIAGVGTIGLEIMQQEPTIDTVISPVGAGTGCGGTAIAVKSIKPETRVIAVQAENAPSVYRSWRSGALESTGPVSTMADGLATRQAFKLPLGILRDWVDEFTLVSEDEMRHSVRLYLEHCRTVAEGAGAAPLAAAIKMRNELKGRRVALVLSGGNITLAELKRCLEATD